MIRLAPSFAPALAALLALSACTSSDQTSPVTEGTSADGAAIEQPAATAAETVHFTGTEPFWGGEVTGTLLTYSTPETPDGTQIEVTRMDGKGGFSFSGTLDGQPFDMAVSDGQCSDGMSDVTYPYGVTLKVKGEQRSGCAWSESNPKVDPRA